MVKVGYLIGKPRASGRPEPSLRCRFPECADGKLPSCSMPAFGRYPVGV